MSVLSTGRSFLELRLSSQCRSALVSVFWDVAAESMRIQFPRPKSPDSLITYLTPTFSGNTEYSDCDVCSCSWWCFMLTLVVLYSWGWSFSNRKSSSNGLYLRVSIHHLGLVGSRQAISEKALTELIFCLPFNWLSQFNHLATEVEMPLL